MKAYKIELLIIDFDSLGEEEIKEIIETTKYPNYCISPQVKKIVEGDIGEWHDDHPLNKKGADYEKYFINKPFVVKLLPDPNSPGNKKLFVCSKKIAFGQTLWDDLDKTYIPALLDNGINGEKMLETWQNFGAVGVICELPGPLTTLVDGDELDEGSFHLART